MAGTAMLVQEPEDDLEELKEEVLSDMKAGLAVHAESSRPIALKRTDGAGIRTPDLLIPAPSDSRGAPGFNP